MEFELQYVFAIVLTILISFLLSFYLYCTRNFSYWKIRYVPYVKPLFPFGSITDLALAKTYIGKAYHRMYSAFPNERYFGIIDIQDPVLVLRDPDLIRAVMTKDFDHFTAKTNVQTSQMEYILRHCTNMQGQEWKEMRALLSPAFTSVKIKRMYELMVKCSDNLREHISSLIEHTPNSQVEITNILARFTMDMIATSAFGFETDSINNPNCKFFLTMVAMLKTTSSRFLKRLLTSLMPSVVKKICSFKMIPTDVTSLLTTAVSETVKYREENNVIRTDFLDSLINTKRQLYSLSEKINTHSSQDILKTGLSIEQMTAQAFNFFIAGFSTNTSNMTFCLYELARHQAVQETLLNDIHQALNKHGGEMNYQAIQDMIYLDQVIQETMRLYGSGQTLMRICTKQYKIPNSDVTLEKGIRVLIPIYSLHHDSKYFQNPYSFNPERFSLDTMKERHPYVYLPFGEGPRNCIARNFGLLQMKLGVATVISNFQVELDPNQEAPIDIDKRSFVVTPAHPVFLRLTRRKNTS